MSFAFLGTYFGLAIEQKYMNTNKYPLFYKTSLITTLVRIFVSSVVVLPMISSLVLIKKNNPFFIVLIGRNVWPAGFGTLLIYTITKFVAIKLGLANMTQIENEQIEQDKYKQKNIDGSQSINKIKKL